MSRAPNRRIAFVRLGCALMIAAAGAGAAFGILVQHNTFTVPHGAPQWVAGYLVFVLAYGLAERADGGRMTPWRIGLLAAQAVMAQYLVWLYPSFLVTILIVVVAWQVAWAAPLRVALAVAAALALGMVLVKCADQTGAMSLVVLLTACGFQLFAVAAAHLARSEAEARLELARANAELTATHALLTESARMGERLRISRDLHDVLGHNLTTLQLHLDVASRLADGPAAQHLTHARDVAGALLGEVRAVVAQVRVEPVDLRATLMALTEGLSGLSVRLELPDDLDALDPARADAVLRCVQELITNALRHADARELVVALSQGPEGALVLAARDDGKGGPFVEGQGLTGMRERFEALGGSLKVVTAAGAGFAVEGAIPAVGAFP